MTLIDLNALKEWIENWLVMNKHYHPYSKNNSIPISELYDVLEIMPTVELVNHGHWIKSPISWMCSCCGTAYTVARIETDGKFCPHCGAKMEIKNG